ncbi:DUF4097 family beta strand repeat protein [Candidatus Bipolaricaulota bacterium]|nr:DUF4097 family beta strand repeat protein [Candidatus Bipolaricaulota bacterium]
MRKIWIHVVIGLVVAAALLMLVGCDEEGEQWPKVEATRQEEAMFSVGDSAVIDADTSNGEIIVRGVEGAQEVHVVATLRTRGNTLEEAEERLDKIVYSMTQDGQTVRLRYQASDQEKDVRRYSGVGFEVTVPTETRVDAETSNGAITIEAVSGRLDLDTSNGRIDLEGIVGSVRADTSNGSIDLEKIDGEVNADTSNGSIRYEGRPVGQGNTLHTSNGSITVRIHTDASVSFEVDAKDGGIRSSLPLVGDTEGDHWDVVLTPPPAEAAMSLRTSNGTIRIEPLP